MWEGDFVREGAFIRINTAIAIADILFVYSETREDDSVITCTLESS